MREFTLIHTLKIKDLSHLNDIEIFFIKNLTFILFLIYNNLTSYKKLKKFGVIKMQGEKDQTDIEIAGKQTNLIIYNHFGKAGSPKTN